MIQTTVRTRLVACAWLAGGFWFVAGCGGDPVSSNTSGYRVAGQDEDDAEQGGKAGGSADERVKPTVVTPRGGGESPAATRDSVGAPQQPASVAASDLRDETVPGGSAEDVAAWLNTLPADPPYGGQADEHTRFRRKQELRIEGAERILAMGSAASTEARRAAVDHKLLALSIQFQYGDQEAANEIRDFSDRLAADKDPLIASKGKQMILGLHAFELAGGQPREPQELKAELQHILATYEKDAELFTSSLQAAHLLESTGQPDHVSLALDFYGMTINAFRTSEDESISRSCQELAVEVAAKRVAYGQGGSPAAIAAGLKQLHARHGADLRVFAVGVQSAETLEQTGTPEAEAAAIEIYRFLGQAFADTTDENLARSRDLLLLHLHTVETVRGERNNPAEIGAEVKQIIARHETEEDVFAAGFDAADILESSGNPQLLPHAIGICRMIGAAFANHEDPALAEHAVEVSQRAVILEAGVDQRLQDLLGKKPGAADALLATARQVAAVKSPGNAIYEAVSQSAMHLEMNGDYAQAGEAYRLLEATYQSHADKLLAAQAAKQAEYGSRRVSLIGKPFTVPATKLDGGVYDWSRHRGKVVLIDFWATWCGPCRAELPNLVANYQRFQRLGFEVVGVNVDEDAAAVQEFLAANPLPWETVRVDNPGALLDLYGAEGIPFVVLIGRDGNVTAINEDTRGEQLGRQLAAILGGGSPPPAGGASLAPPRELFDIPAETFFTAIANEEPADEPAADDDAGGNPYAPADNLTVDELVDFILDMEEKPATIQRRPGFSEALITACDRVLAASPKPAHERIAALAKFQILHRDASFGDEQADEALQKFAEQMKDNPQEKIQAEVKFLLLEREAINVDDLPLEKVPDLLARLKAFFQSQEKLTERHLRIASSAVHVVNRLEDGEEREEHFAEFGKLFAESKDRQLANYGKKLSTKPPVDNLVGKPLELEGLTALGAEFDWKSYRGKVVLVDFWATWCGPCRREMPHVKEAYESLKEKGFEVVGVSLDKDLEALAQYLQENEIAWENLAGDDTQELAGKYGVRGIPTMILVDGEGVIVAVGHQAGPLVKQAEELLAKAAE